MNTIAMEAGMSQAEEPYPNVESTQYSDCLDLGGKSMHGSWKTKGLRWDSPRGWGEGQYPQDLSVVME